MKLAFRQRSTTLDEVLGDKRTDQVIDRLESVADRMESLTRILEAQLKEERDDAGS